LWTGLEGPVIDHLLVGHIELLGNDGGILEGGESLDGAGALHLGLQGDPQQRLEVTLLEILEGDLKQPGEKAIQSSDLCHSNLLGSAHVARGDCSDDRLDLIIEDREIERVLPIGLWGDQGFNRSEGLEFRAEEGANVAFLLSEAPLFVVRFRLGGDKIIFGIAFAHGDRGFLEYQSAL
jgi:hypothetical protein